MGEQDAITPLASGVNQGPAVPFLKGTIGSRLAQVAQLVEQRIENPRVTGSIPVLGTIAIHDVFIAFLYQHHRCARASDRKNLQNFAGIAIGNIIVAK